MYCEIYLIRTAQLLQGLRSSCYGSGDEITICKFVSLLLKSGIALTRSKILRQPLKIEISGKIAYLLRADLRCKTAV